MFFSIELTKLGSFIFINLKLNNETHILKIDINHTTM